MMNFIIRFANVQQQRRCAVGVAAGVALNEGRPRQRSARIERWATLSAMHDERQSRGNSNKNNTKWNCYAHYMTALPASQSDNSKRQQQRDSSSNYNTNWGKKAPATTDNDKKCAIGRCCARSPSLSASLSHTFVQVGGGSARLWHDEIMLYIVFVQYNCSLYYI